MGYMPCYLFPEKLEEDDEFEYYKFRVPRHYIREHIADGDIWPDYEETEEEGTKDKSAVLGVGFLLVYTGVEYLDSDADFLYYRVRVPKVFLDSPALDGRFTYRVLYDAGTLEVKSDRTPKAGESMVGKEELETVRKVKKSDPLLYEVTFKCKNVEDCGIEFKEIGSVLFDMLYSQSCPECDHPLLEMKECKILVEEGKDVI